MLNFGSRAPRMAECFGVASLLGEDCNAFYESIFSVKHVGRISDLLTARLRESGVDEIKLRAIVLFSTFFGYVLNNPSGENSALSEPLSVECGIDAEKIALSVSFMLPEDAKLNLDGIAERIKSGKLKGLPESLVFYLYRHANQIVIRKQKDTRRIEITALVGIPGKIDAATLSKTKLIEVIEFERAAESPPQPASFIELGDLDYPALLREEGLAAAAAQPSPAGEILSQAAAAVIAQNSVIASAPENPAEVRLAAGPAEEKTQATVKGGGANDDFKTKVKGQAQSPDNTRTKIGNKSDVLRDEKIVVKGGEQDLKTDDTVIRLKADKNPKQKKTGFFNNLLTRKKEPAAPDKNEEEQIITIDSKLPEKDKTTIRLKSSGGPVETQDRTKIVLKNAGGTTNTDQADGPEIRQAAEQHKTQGQFRDLSQQKPASAAPDTNVSQIYLNQISELQKKIAMLEAEKERKPSFNIRLGDEKKPEGAAVIVPRQEEQAQKGLMGKIWPFKNKQEEAARPAAIAIPPETNQQEIRIPGHNKFETDQTMIRVPSPEQKPEEKKKSSWLWGGGKEEKQDTTARKAQDERAEREREQFERQQDQIRKQQEQIMKLQTMLEQQKLQSSPAYDSAPASTITGQQEQNIVISSGAAQKPDREDPENESDELVREIERGKFNKMVQNAREESTRIKEEIKSTKAKAWVDGLMTELTNEKARLNELAKKLNQSIKQKEHEFKIRETAFQEELRRRDDLIKQKTFAVNHLRDQLAQAQEMMEKMKPYQRAAEEVPMLKQKNETTQKLLNTMKEENAQLQKKMIELRSTSTVDTGTGVKAKGPSYEEFTQIKGKLGQAQKQVEEFKKANVMLMEKLEASKRDRGANTASSEDMRKKLEMAVKSATDAKKEAERSAARTDALQKEERRLKSEISKLMDENKKLRIDNMRASLARPGGGKPGAKAA